MSLFKKLFSGKDKDSSNEQRSKFMPEVTEPTDKRFAINFNKNGGKFIYCETESEVQKAFEHILSENGSDFKILYPNETLIKRFEKYKSFYTISFNQADAYLTECENLIADNGSILFTSRQIGQKKIFELPKTLIVCAKTSQMVNNISDALAGIKQKHKKEKPTNISAFHSFKEELEDDFRTYGSCTKNTYLLLLEDLQH